MLLRRTMDGNRNRLTDGPADEDRHVIAAKAVAGRAVATGPAPDAQPDPFAEP